MSAVVFAMVAVSSGGCWNWNHLDPVIDASGVDAETFDVSVDSLGDGATCGISGAPCCLSSTAAPCASGLICVSATCVACPAGQVLCGAACTDLSSDVANCGACGNSCGAAATCNAGQCLWDPPPNDTRDHATVIDTSTSAITLSANTSGAHHDTTGTCGCTSGNDVFYQFTLETLEIVYVDTLGSSFDTAVFLQDSAGNNLSDPHIAGGTTCSNDGGLGCNTGTQSLLAAKLFDGTYYLVVSGCSAGAATVHFQHLPVGSGTITRVTPLDGASQQFSDSVAGSGTIMSPGCCSDGPENTYWFVTCPSFASSAIHASTCGSASFDTEIDQRSAARAPVGQCNFGACGAQSQVDSTLPAGAGLHMIYIDSCHGALGTYTLSLTFGNCATGAICSAQCIDLETDVSNCGGCGTVCSSNTPDTIPVCIGGNCRTQCIAGYGDCNGIATDGCEASLSTIDHCGSCGTACSLVNGTPFCGPGGCSIVCDPGFGDCDMNASNGCEQNVQTDRNNCGACGHRCIGSRYCYSGVCM